MVCGYYTDCCGLFTWENHDNYDKQIRLSFAGNSAELCLSSCRSDKTIQGFALVDNQSVEIYDTSLSQKFHFDYRLYGDKTELYYQGNTVTLFKVRQQIQK